MNIDEVSEILGLCHALLAPQHVFITDEDVHGKVNGKGSFRGLQPKTRSDVIFLTRNANASTPIHETIHANIGTEEALTKPLTRIIQAKYRLLQNFPTLREAVRKPVKYRVCNGCSEFAEAHSRYRGRVTHFILET
jgi:hypothetical protein